MLLGFVLIERSFIVEHLYFIKGFFSCLVTSRCRLVDHVDDRLALYRRHAAAPILPILPVSDQEPYEHARIHVLNVEASKPASMI